ncbi:hypothetical protein BV25DRAFT_1943026 [Artomyces pyxidatus]|uniref:Uncharacterized protein n=1 Tax=Artomyces pyxidatus TaxID=48021 RepID=A0ACB8T3I2_9AGAM|nr:hypothetical protein BV25DRAFT_1943026 [Artomyces pyxidatus]
MSFKFDFDLADDLDEDFDAIPASTLQPVRKAQPEADISEARLAPSKEIPLSELLATLPEAISYSPLAIPLSSGRQSITLARRDLFDARYQLIAQEGDANADTLEFLDAPSDLVPGVYEGGLKTWECSVDLADYLEGVVSEEGLWACGKFVLELGCGTAIPSVFLLHRLFSALPDAPNAYDPPATHFHLQDYNRSVLELVTLPNVVLAWYMSPLSAEFRLSVPTGSDHDEADASSTADPTTASELALTPALVSAFTGSLAKHHIHLRFFTGAWDTFDPQSILSSSAATSPDEKHCYDLILTSETIYKPDNLPSLLRVLRTAAGIDADPVDRLARLSLEGGTSTLCLVAAKLVYFGVGGGVEEFVRAIEEEHGTAETVWERREGVSRRVMKVRWP